MIFDILEKFSETLVILKSCAVINIKAAVATSESEIFNSPIFFLIIKDMSIAYIVAILAPKWRYPPNSIFIFSFRAM